MYLCDFLQAQLKSLCRGRALFSNMYFGCLRILLYMQEGGPGGINTSWHGWIESGLWRSTGVIIATPFGELSTKNWSHHPKYSSKTMTSHLSPVISIEAQALIIEIYTYDHSLSICATLPIFFPPLSANYSIGPQLLLSPHSSSPCGFLLRFLL